MVSPNLGSLRAARQLADTQVLANPHSHIPGSSATQWGDSSKAGIQTLPVPADSKQPALQIALWQVRNLGVQTASEAQRLGFHMGLKQALCFSPN